VSNSVPSRMIQWFANNLVLNLEKKNEYNEIHNKEFITFYIPLWLLSEVYDCNVEYKISRFTN
jgi:hypothetical protein